MTVVNYQIKKITGSRSGKLGANIQVNAASNILSIKKSNDKRIGDYLEVDFKYEVKYEPEVGDIGFEGSLWYFTNNLKDQATVKKDTVELKKDAVAEITTSIVQDSLLEALDVARKLQLPPPMKLPQVNVKPEKLTFPKTKE